MSCGCCVVLSLVSRDVLMMSVDADVVLHVILSNTSSTSVGGASNNKPPPISCRSSPIITYTQKCVPLFTR